MTDQQTPVLEKTGQATVEPAPAPVPAPPPAPPVNKQKRKKKKKVLKTLITLIVILAVLGGIGFLVWRFVLYQPDNTQVLEDMVQRGSISSTVEGSGVTKAKDSASITPASGTVLEVYVNEGDQVTVGTQLYRMDDTKARDDVANAQKEVENCQRDLQTVYDQIAELTIKAPYTGKLMEVAELKVGDDVKAGDKICTLVNDTKLRLHLYYNYIYEGQISVGQSAQISIPAVMGAFDGTVEKINMVSRIVPEGGTCFEVVFVMDNPGTLTAGMVASAALTGPEGEPIYPYEQAALDYYETKTITAKADGPVESVNLLNYADVSAGRVLVQLGAKNVDEQIATKDNALKAAQEKLSNAQKELEKYNAVSPIDGTVLSCSLVAGQEVQSGQGINIADISLMTVEIQLDQRNAGFVKPGMPITLTDYNDNPYMGMVQSVSVEAKYDNGVTYFPAVVSLENPDGVIMSGQGMRYSFIANESADCLLLPVACVKYVSDETGETSTVVFLKAEQTPENMVTLSEEAMANIPEGYYPVPVEVGLADNYNVEITSGVSEGDVVFNSITMDQGNSYSGGGMGGIMIG